MITADILKTFTSHALQMAVGKQAGDTTFVGSKFLGITNGGQFCYSVVFKSPDFKGTDSAKVYLTYDPAAGKVIADIG